MSSLKTKYFIFISLWIILILVAALPAISEDGVLGERKGFNTIIENRLAKKAESGDGKAAYCLSLNYAFQRKTRL
jgi:hypothetical protein